MSRDLSTQSKIHLAKTVLAKMNIKKAGKSFSLQKEVYLKLKVFNDFPDYKAVSPNLPNSVAS